MYSDTQNEKYTNEPAKESHNRLWRGIIGEIPQYHRIGFEVSLSLSTKNRTVWIPDR